MNNLVISSLLFIAPTILSKKLNVIDVYYATLLVLLTSLLNHSTQNKFLRYCDITCVISIGIYFTILSIFSYKKYKSIYFLIPPLVSLISIIIFIYNKLKKDNEKRHMIIHLLMSIGVCSYTIGVFKNILIN